MSKQMTIKNHFHGTELTATPLVVSEYTTGEKFVEFWEKQLDQFGHELCGMEGCRCKKFDTYCTDENGTKYRIDICIK